MVGSQRGDAPPLRRSIERVAQSSAPVLIRGESGTGKELVARALHFEGPRRERAVRGGQLHRAARRRSSRASSSATRAAPSPARPRRGAGCSSRPTAAPCSSTRSATCRRRSRPSSCASSRTARCGAVGADASRKVDVRVIAATPPGPRRARPGRRLPRRISFYRLNVVPLAVPPLRERLEDIPLLVEHFLAQGPRAQPRHAPRGGFSPELVAALARRPWPGNVRELENVVERLVVVLAGEDARRGRPRRARARRCSAPPALADAQGAAHAPARSSRASTSPGSSRSAAATRRGPPRSWASTSPRSTGASASAAEAGPAVGDGYFAGDGFASDLT